jgi:hypothetical protein
MFDLDAQTTPPHVSSFWVVVPLRDSKLHFSAKLGSAHYSPQEKPQKILWV